VGDVSTGGGWASIGSGDGRRPPSKWVHRVAREAGQSVRERGSFFFFSFLRPTVFWVTGLGGFDLGISVVPKPFVRWTEVKKIPKTTSVLELRFRTRALDLRWERGSEFFFFRGSSGGFFFFLSLRLNWGRGERKRVFRVTGSGGFDLGISVVPKPSCGGPR